jgi:hypothetical protein
MKVLEKLLKVSIAKAQLNEWLAGICTALMVSSFFDRPRQYTPLFILICFITTFTLAMIRKNAANRIDDSSQNESDESQNQ